MQLSFRVSSAAARCDPRRQKSHPVQKRQLVSDAKAVNYADLSMVDLHTSEHEWTVTCAHTRVIRSLTTSAR